jgi:hypothetical protein
MKTRIAFVVMVAACAAVVLVVGLPVRPAAPHTQVEVLQFAQQMTFTVHPSSEFFQYLGWRTRQYLDSRAALQSSHLAFMHGVHTVYLGPGEFMFDKNTMLYSEITYIGAGWEQPMHTYVEDR